MEGYEGVNAADLAAVLQMDRANVSKELQSSGTGKSGCESHWKTGYIILMQRYYRN